MKIKKINVIIFITMFINVFLAFPLILISIFKKKESPFLIGLFFGVLGFYFEFKNGTGDLGRYYSMFEFSKESREILWNYQKDFYAQFMIESLIKFKLPKNLLAASSAFITYYFLYKSINVFFLKIKNNYNGKKRLTIYIFLFILISIVGYTGIRFYPALTVMLYAIILKFKVKDRKYILLSILAIMIHSSMLLPTMLLFLDKFYIFCIKNFRKFKIVILLFFLLGTIFDSKNFIYIINFINSLEIIYIHPNYILGIWGERYIEKFIGISRVIRIYIILSYNKLISLFYIIVVFGKDKLEQYIALLTLFYFFTQNFFSISERYYSLILIGYYFIIIEKSLYRKYHMIFFLLIIFNRILITILELKDYLPSFIESYSQLYKISLFNIFIQIFS